MWLFLSSWTLNLWNTLHIVYVKVLIILFAERTVWWIHKQGSWLVLRGVTNTTKTSVVLFQIVQCACGCIKLSKLSSGGSGGVSVCVCVCVCVCVRERERERGEVARTWDNRWLFLFFVLDITISVYVIQMHFHMSSCITIWNRTRSPTRELISARNTSHKHNRPESSTVILARHANKYKIHKLHYHRWLVSLLCLCDVFQVLV